MNLCRRPDKTPPLKHNPPGVLYELADASFAKLDAYAESCDDLPEHLKPNSNEDTDYICNVVLIKGNSVTEFHCGACETEIPSDIFMSAMICLTCATYNKFYWLDKAGIKAYRAINGYSSLCLDNVLVKYIEVTFDGNFNIIKMVEAV